ncbi:gamma-glutamylcyclotransferase [Amaricoccus solimangrovi]|uniref:glutathione-specific gamma-glutamylcyclotransferase n=2 Tax=Amaricoccus solimangrovi TaxID=2589815 RepID=A0A501WTH6_9RHOB|nr:gamma-glutamylcyclotransferase [Amaricoccus solimangrovi]
MRLTPEMVRRAHREEPDPGPGPGFTPATEAESAALVEALLARPEAPGPGEPLYVFAYGSLIWKPEFEVTESLRGTLRGWHRSFCISLTRWRGSPACPGLMLALERGGTCVGLLLRLPAEGRTEALVKLVRREIPHREGADMARWSQIDTARGRLPALVFWAGPKGPNIEHRLPLGTVAHRLAHACGHGGSGAEYLYNTVEHLEAAGIHDRNLWRLQDLVAEEIGAWPLPRA